ncbi:MAG: ATP-binding protein [Desulfotomaculaceae bacterium]|nr:ATP-binding protein [Desulfotomaculaceae bacterium]
MLELSHHLLDLIENSLAAGASTIKLIVIENTASDILSLEVTDDGHGLSKDEINQLCDPFMTSRRFRKVGLGIPLLQQAAQCCMGGLEIKSKEGVGTKVRATFQHSHIDRMPLGDITATIMAVIAAKPDLNLFYVHVVNGREFTFNTKVLINNFKDIPFNDVRVLIWIKKYCQDGIKKLYSDK